MQRASLTRDPGSHTLAFDSRVHVSMNSQFALSLVFLLCMGIFASACEDVSHDNIDKWGHTEKGPGKLVGVLKSAEHSPALRAHAAQVMVELDRFGDIKDILEGLDEKPRQEIMAELATRLWELARINKELDIPNSSQTRAKDVLFFTIDFADAPTQAKMADYLVEWFVGGHYEGRATAGKVSGAMAIRRVGKSSAERLLNRARGIISRPPGEDGKRDQLGEELLKALALSGSPDALEFLMQLVHKPRGDTSLPGRAIAAMHFAYVEPVGMDPVGGSSIAAIAKKLEAIYYNEGQSATIRNDSSALLGTLEATKCIPIFARMIRHPGQEAEYRWVGTRLGAKCGGAQGIEAITSALPVSVDYERGMLSKYLWDHIWEGGDKKKIATAAGALLESKSWVSRVTGIELLGMLGKDGNVPENIELIRALAGDQHLLKNWWGKQEDVPKAEQKPTPTIGRLASDVAKSLETLALEGEGK